MRDVVVVGAGHNALVAAQQELAGVADVQVFGENGRAARSAVGMGSLPGNITVEVEAIVMLKKQ